MKFKKVNFRSWLSAVKANFDENKVRTEESYFYMEWWNDVRDMLRLR